MLITGAQEKQILMKAREERWGLGAFNVFDIPTAEAVFRAAEALDVPVMIQTWDYYKPDAESSFFNCFEAKVFNRFLTDRAELSPVPVMFHLDHTPSFEGCLRGMQAGATSVMFDGSETPFEDNVAGTKKVVEAAHPCGVLVEGEIGHVSGNSGLEAMYTEVADAVAYYEQTGIDLCAVSIGTVHGYYKDEPKLNYDRIAEIREALPIPLVMHGSSGLTEEMFRKAIAAGIVKINFATYVQLIAGKAVAEAAAEAERPYFETLNKIGLDAATEYIKKHMEIFGTKHVDL